MAVGKVCLHSRSFQRCFPCCLLLAGQAVTMLACSVRSFLWCSKSVLKDTNAFLLTRENCPVRCFWASPASSPGTAWEQVPRAAVGEAACVLQHRGGNRTTSSCCPRGRNVGPLTAMGVPSVLHFSVHVFSFQYLFKIM